MNITTENYDKLDAFGFLGTLSGKKLHFLNPQPEEFCLEDISNALSKNCRYAGQVKDFYSVAEHSILMARYFMRKGEWSKAYCALLHDATEAYLVDIPRPIKPHLKGYLEMEAKLQEVIFERFNVPSMCKDVKHMDCHIVHDEAKVLFKTAPDWIKHYESFDIELDLLTHQEAKIEFERLFWVLRRQLGFQE